MSGGGPCLMTDALAESVPTSIAVSVSGGLGAPPLLTLPPLLMPPHHHQAQACHEALMLTLSFTPPFIHQAQAGCVRRQGSLRRHGHQHPRQGAARLPAIHAAQRRGGERASSPLPSCPVPLSPSALTPPGPASPSIRSSWRSRPLTWRSCSAG